MTVQKPDPSKPVPGVPVLDSSSLFKGLKEIIITHNGQEYRLRITSRDKLILQK